MATEYECPGCKYGESVSHWRSCPRWDNPVNGGLPESEDDYALACDAQYAADPTHTPTTSNDAECDLCGRAVHIAPYSGELVHGYDPTMGE